MPTPDNSKHPTATTGSAHRNTITPGTLTEDLKRLSNLEHHDPFTLLGRHRWEDHDLLRIHLPGAKSVQLVQPAAQFSRIEGSDIFYWFNEQDQELPERYQVRWTDQMGIEHLEYDPYCFLPQLRDFDLHLFREGKHWHAYRFLGSHVCTVDGIKGVMFASWAPNAKRISVVGDFNHWDGRRHPMRNRGASGVWELFIPELEPGSCYKYEIKGIHGEILLKSDPYGQAFELRPKTASVINAPEEYPWRDQQWLEQRENDSWLHRPISVYEIHLGSWQKDHGDFLNYRELAHRLVEYVKETGFTHIQLLPITEHPFDGSWGYQTTGYFAPTSRFGSANDFRYFVDYCHKHNIGVLLDWVPAHFPKDDHSLARFDGSPLYEHADPRRGEHRDWGTLIFNYGRNEVKNFLLSSAFFWLEEYHIDGLRVDAVASMLYLDYSREEGDWEPNIYGGNENLEAIGFLRQINEVIHGEFPGCMVIAEESTAWPQVTRPTYLGGLGFSMKWNMGWMHDTLTYFSKDSVYRHYHHDQLTFGLLYAFTENFMLPLSHDEVVHGKSSILYKMPGDEWQRFANVRLLYTFMFSYPGKKLLFMGNEFAQGIEWNADDDLEWHLLEYDYHSGIKKLVGDLNNLYRNESPLYHYDFDHHGFQWIDCHDTAQSVISYMRKDDQGFIIAVLNFTPIPRYHYRIGVPQAGVYEEVFNSDSQFYGGSNLGNGHDIGSEETPWMDQPHSILLTLPPLAGCLIRLKK